MNRELANQNRNDAPPADCRETLELLQGVLDGEASFERLKNDRHSRSCLSCQERVRAAMVFTKAFASVADTRPKLTIPVEAILATASRERTRRVRSRWLTATAGMTLAAGAMLVLLFRPDSVTVDGPPRLVEVTKPVAPLAAPPRIDQAFTDAGEAIQGLGRMITEQELTAPEMLAPFSLSLTQPLPLPISPDFEPAASSLAALPEAALHGLEPLTDGATRVFTRLLQDVAAMPTTAAPKEKS